MPLLVLLCCTPNYGTHNIRPISSRRSRVCTASNSLYSLAGGLCHLHTSCVHVLPRVTSVLGSGIICLRVGESFGLGPRSGSRGTEFSGPYREWSGTLSLNSPAVTPWRAWPTTNDIKTLGLFYHGNWRRSLGGKAWRWPLPVAFDHAYSDFLRPTGRPLLLSTVVLRAVFRPCRVCHLSRSLPSRDGRWQTEVCTVFRTGIVFYSICWNESEASLEPPARRLDTIPTSNSRTGDTGSEATSERCVAPCPVRYSM